MFRSLLLCFGGIGLFVSGIVSCSSPTTTSIALPDTLHYIHQVDFNVAHSLMPDTWKADTSYALVLIQHKMLLTMEEITNQRRVFTSSYCRAAVADVAKIYIYTSDDYYNMMFDGGERAALLDVGREKDLPAFRTSEFTVLMHVPSKRVLARYPGFMEMYALCDWIDSARKEITL